MVEVLGKVAQLVVPPRFHMDGVVALRHLPRRAGKLAQRLCEPLTEQPRRAHGEREDQRRRQRQHRAQHRARLGNVHQGGADEDGIGPVRRHPPHNELIIGRGLGRREHAGKIPVLAAVLAHLTGRRIERVVVQRIREGFLMQTAIGQVLVFFDGSEGGVRDIDAEAAQLPAGIDLAAELVEELLVRDLDTAERPVGKGRARRNASSILVTMRSASSVSCFWMCLVYSGSSSCVLRNQNIPSNKKADQAQKPHQLPPDADGAPFFSCCHIFAFSVLRAPRPGRTYSRCPTPLRKGHGAVGGFGAGHAAVEHWTRHQPPGGEGLDHSRSGTSRPASLSYSLAAGGQDDDEGC